MSANLSDTVVPIIIILYCIVFLDKLVKLLELVVINKKCYNFLSAIVFYRIA